MSEPLSILIADDEPLIRKTLRMLLNSAGFAVQEAANGEEALASLKTTRPSLVIADINMPGNGGLEFVRAVAAGYPGLPVILLTAYPTMETAVASVNLSVAAYLIKPPNVNEVLDAVHAAVGQYEARTAIERSLSRLDEWSADLQKLQQLSLNVRASADANASGAYLELSIRHLMGSMLELREVVAVLSAAPSGSQSVRALELAKALEETVGVLEKTKRVFRSKDLGDLRQKLESVLAAARG